MDCVCCKKLLFCFLIFFTVLAAPASTIQRYLKQFEDQWFKFCDEELEKINTFYAGKFYIGD